MNSGLRMPAALFWLGLLAPAIALASVWLPELQHYYVRAPAVSPAEAHELVDALPDTVCTDLVRFTFDFTRDAPAEQIEQAQRAVALGLYAAPGRPPAPFAPQFERTELAGDALGPDLYHAMLVIPQLLIGAYESSGDLTALRTAGDYLRGWWRFEKASWLPTGFQWNDHAVAGRVYPLSRFLCIARALPDFDDADVREIVSALLASGERLTKADYYTFRTNHGFMQSVALLHLAALFPSRPESARFKAVAYARIVQQLDYYLSPDGVVLEHSAGYHDFGVYLVSLALRYFDELGLRPPAGLDSKYEAARMVLAQLRRPDASLPAWGNTRSSGRPPVQVQEARLAMVSGDAGTTGDCPAGASLSAPVSGLSIWWDRAATSPCGESRLAQTVVVWSDFPSRAHKHVDEMSAYIWSRGFNILTGSGYWPYFDVRNALALGWASGNGPRFVGERESERGITVPVRIAHSETAEFIELVRTPTSGSRLRRQILYVRPDHWLIIDSDDSEATSAQREFEFHFTIDPRLSVARATDPLESTEVFRVLYDRTEVAQLLFSGCRGGSTDIVRGSEQPFIGWTAERGIIETTDAILRRCPGGSVSVLRLNTAPSSPPVLGLEAAPGHPDGWTIPLSERTATRLGDLVELRDDGVPSASQVSLRLTAIEGYDAAVGEIGRKYGDAASSNRRYNESWLTWRFKITRPLIVLAALHVAGFLGGWSVVRRRPVIRKWLPVVGLASIAAWTGLAYWLAAYYFTQ